LTPAEAGKLITCIDPVGSGRPPISGLPTCASARCRSGADS